MSTLQRDNQNSIGPDGKRARWVLEVGRRGEFSSFQIPRMPAKVVASVLSLTNFVQVKSSIPTSFITSFFVQSKKTIRSAMASQDDISSSSFSCTRQGDDEYLEPKSATFSCWKFLLCRRDSRILTSEASKWRVSRQQTTHGTRVACRRFLVASRFPHPHNHNTKHKHKMPHGQPHGKKSKKAEKAGKKAFWAKTSAKTLWRSPYSSE